MFTIDKTLNKILNNKKNHTLLPRERPYKLEGGAPVKTFLKSPSLLYSHTTSRRSVGSPLPLPPTLLPFNPVNRILGKSVLVDTKSKDRAKWKSVLPVTGPRWKTKPYRYYEQMTPQEYLRRAGTGPDLEYYYDTVEQKRLPTKVLAEKMKKGISVNPPFVYGYMDQEGRHRAKAAEMIGQKTIPVLVPRPPSHYTPKVKETFFLKARAHGQSFYGGYGKEWENRLESGEADKHMDSRFGDYYYRALREQGVVEPTVEEQQTTESFRKTFNQPRLVKVPIDTAFEMRRKQSGTGSMEPKREPYTMAAIKARMQQGDVEPIVVDEEDYNQGKLTDGKHRLIIAKQLKMKDYPVLIKTNTE